MHAEPAAPRRRRALAPDLPLYAAHFGLTQAPFSIAPDPRYLYMSQRHREALAHLLYGLRGGGGFVLLTGAIGAGKTTVCRLFIEQIPPDCSVAYIFNPKLTVPELLLTVAQEFGLQPPVGESALRSVKAQVDALNAYLLAQHAQGRHCVLLVDEAQNLSSSVLEQLRLLTNLETSERKLLQIVLIGQPELRALLAQPQMEQLAQRVIARYHLDALGGDEVRRYIEHRLAVAGWRGPQPFDARALARIRTLTGGVPRRINLLCDRALLGAYAQSSASVNASTVAQAAREVFDTAPASGGGVGGVWRTALGAAARPLRPAWTAPAVAAAAACVLLLVVALVWWARRDTVPPAPVPSSQAAAPASVARLPVAPASLPVTAAASAAGAGEAVAVDGRAAAGAVADTAVPPQARWADDDAAAWQALATLWGQPAQVPRSADACAQLAAAGLWCYGDRGGMPLLREFNRPVLLTVTSADGSRAQVLLRALRGDMAELLTPAGQRLQVALAALLREWTGEWRTLWRAPPGYSRPLTPGVRGPAVDQLARQLALWSERTGRPPVRHAVGATFGAELQAQVRAFQRDHRLREDGRVGPATWMHLNVLAGVAEPKLMLTPQITPAASTAAPR